MSSKMKSYYTTLAAKAKNEPEPVDEDDATTIPIDGLLPVPILGQEEYYQKNYYGSLYPEGFEGDLDTWEKLFESYGAVLNTLNNVSARFAMILDTMTTIVDNTYNLGDPLYGDPKAKPELFDKLLATKLKENRSYYRNSKRYEPAESEAIEKYSEDMVAFMARSDSYIMSRGKKGSISVSFLGTNRQPPIGQLGYNSFSAPESVESLTERLNHDDFKRRIKSDAVRAHILKTYTELYNALIQYMATVVPGASKNLHTKVVAVKPLDFDFSTVKGGFPKAFMEYLVGDRDIWSVNKHFTKTRGEWVDLLVVREASMAYIQNLKSKQEGNKRKNLEVPDSQILKEVKPDSDDMVNVEISLSVVINLPEKFGRIITQTPSGPVSFATMCSFLSIWQDMYLKNGNGDIPDYIMPLTHLADSNVFGLKELDMSRADEHQQIVTADGTIAWVPTVSPQVAESYDKQLEEAIEASYKLGMPFNSSNTTVPSFYSFNQEPADVIAVTDSRVKLNKFKGLPLAVNWNVNTALTPQLGDASALNALDLQGAITPDDLTLDDFLSMPISEALAKYTGDDETKFSDLLPTINNFYTLLSLKKLVPSEAAILKQAESELKREREAAAATDPESDEFMHNKWTTELDTANVHVYTNLSPDGGFQKETPDTEDTFPVNNLAQLFAGTIQLASRVASRQMDLLNLEPDDHPNYINVYGSPKNHSSPADFYRLNGLLGGRCWFKAMHYLAAALNKPNALEKLVLEDDDKYKNLSVPNFSEMSGSIMPIVLLWGRHIPLAPKIRENAAKTREKFQPTGKPSDVPALPGVQPGFAFLPHQARSNAYSRSFPHDMIQNISAGGGKTLTTASEILMYLDMKKIKRPLVVLPQNLIGQWASEVPVLAGKNMNVIPITSASINEWGFAALEKMITESTENTIVLTTYSVISARPQVAMYGSKEVLVYGNLEFLRKFGFDYVALDESHLTKNETSFTSKAILSFVASKSVKFLRHLSGTIISNGPADLVGQLKMVNPVICRTTEEFVAEHGKDVRGVAVGDWKPTAMVDVRNRLDKFMTFFTARKKDWAYLLPTPVERFVPVELDDLEEMAREAGKNLEHMSKGEVAQLRNSGPLMTLYNEFLQKTIDELMNNPKIRKLIEEAEASGDDTVLAKLESALNAQLQKLEQFVCDPSGDPEISKALKGKELPISGKTREIAKMVRYHMAHRKSENPNANKILVAGWHKRAARAFYEGLPQDLKEIAFYYDASHKDKLREFQDPKSKLRICVAAAESLTLGHNMQMVNYIILAQNFWAPGKVDQLFSRAMRPDPSGKYTRKYLYIDYLNCDYTLDMCKMGRFISKNLINTSFYEQDNTRYADLPQLPKISMGLEWLRRIRSQADVMDYIMAHQVLMRKDEEEFHEARVKAIKDAGIKGIEVTTLEEFQKLTLDQLRAINSKLIVQSKSKPVPEYWQRSLIVPFADGQVLAEAEEQGLITVEKMLKDADGDLDALERLVGAVVRTQFGAGTLTRIGPNKSKVQLFHPFKYADLEVPTPGQKTFGSANSKTYVVTVPEVAQALKEAKPIKGKKVKIKDLPPEPPVAPTAPDRIKDKPVKNPKIVGPDTEVVAPEVEEENISITDLKNTTTYKEKRPVYVGFTRVNGKLGVYAYPESKAAHKTVAELGFKPQASHVVMYIPSKAALDAALTKIYSLFSVPKSLQGYMAEFQAIYKGNASGKQLAKLRATAEQMKNFFRLNHTISKQDELKVYPVLMDGDLYLYADVAIQKKQVAMLLNKVKVPGTAWERADGMYLMFVTDKARARKAITNVMGSAYISNLKDLKKEFAEVV